MTKHPQSGILREQKKCEDMMLGDQIVGPKMIRTRPKTEHKKQANKDE